MKNQTISVFISMVMAYCSERHAINVFLAGSIPAALFYEDGRRDCDTSYLCHTSTTTDKNSTFMDINMKFVRNYNSIGAIIAPIIGIFYLLGVIFIVPRDRLDNRLMLALSVFALIFALPPICKGPLLHITTFSVLGYEDETVGIAHAVSLVVEHRVCSSGAV